MVLPVVGSIQAGSLENQFFPSLSRDQFQIEVEFAQQSAIASARTEVTRARNLLKKHKQIKEVHWFVGQSAPKFYYNITSSRENSPYYAQAIVQLRSPDNIEDLIQSVQAELDEVLPNAQILVR